MPTLVFTIMKQINKYFEFSLYVKYVLKFCVVDSTCSHTDTKFFKSIKMSNITDIQSLKQFLLAGRYIRHVCLQSEAGLKVFKMSPQTSKFARTNRIHFCGQACIRLDSKPVLDTKLTAIQPNQGQSISS